MLTPTTVSATTLPTRRSTRTPLLALSFVAATFSQVASAGGPQFVDETTTRFPQPGLLEYTNQLTVGDIDGDGDLDLLFANGGNFSSAGTPQKLRVFINDGTGVFTDETDARTGGLTFLARGVELGDIEHDGDLDIIVAQDFNRQPTLLVNDGNGVFTNETATRVPIGTFSSTRAQFGDIDNDGDLDLYFTNGGSVSRWGSARGKLWFNDGAGVFTDVTATNTPNLNTSEPQDVIFGDIDGDLDLDARIASTASNQGRTFRNINDGLLTVITGPSDNNCYSYDFGHLDGNGTLDLLGANAHPTITNAELALFGSGNGLYVAGGFTGSSVDDNDSKFFDVDNDGDFDIIIGSLSSTERLYSNNGSGVFTLVPGAFTTIGDSTLDIKVADVNNDGRYDVITGQGESGSFINRIYINNGPVDTIPPTIETLEKLIDTALPGPYVVRAGIYDAHSSDRGFFDKGITLWWRYGGEGDFNPVDMYWVGNSLWRGEIPEQPEGFIEYYVTATDWANNMATSKLADFCFKTFIDCNNNCASDADDILLGDSADCNENLIPDECEVDVPPCPTGACCLTDGSCVADVNEGECTTSLGGAYVGDGVNCKSAGCKPPATCPADFVDSGTFQPPPDGAVDAADLAYLLGEWGRNPGSLADIVTSATFQPPPDGMVDAADLAFLLGDWGTCE